MKVEAKIALRYLFAKKSHNVINVISGISAAGMAIGAAALVIILSVYNGFTGIISKSLSDFDPDFRIVSASAGGVFDASQLDLESISSIEGVSDVRKCLEFEAFATYDSRQAMVTLRGSEDNMLLYDGDYPQALVGSSLAAKLCLNPRFLTPLMLHYVNRSEPVSLVSPERSLRSERVWPASTVSISSETDEKLVIIPLQIAESLYGGAGNTVSGIDITLESRQAETKKAIQRLCGEDFRVLDRREQHPELYKMMKLEKAAVFGIMIIIVLLIALNIYGSLSMLIIEKKEDIATLSALGADAGMIRRIFILEGWMISAAGMIVGLSIGLAASLAQQRFGIITMPGNFLVQAYPVMVKATDIAAAAFSILLSGGLISSLVGRSTYGA